MQSAPSTLKSRSILLAVLAPGSHPKETYQSELAELTISDLPQAGHNLSLLLSPSSGSKDGANSLQIRFELDFGTGLLIETAGTFCVPYTMLLALTAPRQGLES